MTLKRGELNRAIKQFASQISDQPLGLLIYRPDQYALPTNCISNAMNVQKSRGGDIRYGWYFSHRISEQHGDYLIATNHAVWHEPESLRLIDVTPYHDEEKHRPILGNDVDPIFLVDDQAQPFCISKYIVPLPSRFFAVHDDRALQEYVENLQRQEFESYNKEHGSSFR